MKSISGIRGVIGNGLDPVTITTYGAAFGSYLKRGKVVIGSDTRPSGEMVRRAVTAGLMAVGCDVVDIGIVPTPTVEIAVTDLKASGGICVTASHNPASWNALKFFNAAGEFLTPAQYRQMNRLFEYRVDEVDGFTGDSTSNLWWTLHENFGFAGERYVGWLAQNTHRIKEDLAKVQAKIDKAAGIRGDERYWSAIAATAIYGGRDSFYNIK